MPRVSVIMAAYNGASTIADSIASVLAQNFSDIELIVIDDGSTDETRAIVAGITDPRLSLLSRENSGSPAAPRNQGIKNSQGELIAFCDQDDLWEVDKLKVQLEAYDSSPEKDFVGIIYSSANLINEKSVTVDHNVITFPGYLEKGEAYLRLLKGDFITACSAMVPKKVLTDVGLLDEALVGVDDYDLWLRISEKYGILGVEDSLCSWRQSAGSLSSDRGLQYVRTEAIFSKFDQSEPVVAVGHNNNLIRIVTTSLLVGDYTRARQYLSRVQNLEMSIKSKLIISSARISIRFSGVVVKALYQLGLVRL